MKVKDGKNNRRVSKALKLELEIVVFTLHQFCYTLDAGEERILPTDMK
jgi:hypothetical protein